jgi:hypothetical protein
MKRLEAKVTRSMSGDGGSVAAGDQVGAEAPEGNLITLFDEGRKFCKKIDR